jgi:hypothetical protein
MKNTIEYRLISAHYGDRTAKRSGVRLMNHIDEGLVILNAISATEYSKRAFCLHPLLQEDKDLMENFHFVASSTDVWTMMLVMEYRNIANAYLSDKINTEQPLKLSPLFEVNEMLIADKVQNKKDFITYHYGTHARSDELARYFNKWLNALGIESDTYTRLCKRIDDERTN